MGEIPGLKCGEKNTSSGFGVGEAVGFRVDVEGMGVVEGVIVRDNTLVGVIVGAKVDSTCAVSVPAMTLSSPIKLTDGFSSWDVTQADKINKKMTVTIILPIRIKILAGDESMY